MKTKTSLLTIISVVAVAAVAFPSFDAEKLDADSANPLAATAETFPSFNQNATAAFPLSDAEADATTTAAFLPWLFFLRIQRRLARQFARKRNNPEPSKRRFLHQIAAGIGCGQARRGVLPDAFKEPLPSFWPHSFAFFQSNQ